MHKYLRQIKNNETSVTIAKCSISLSTLAHLTRAVVHPDDKFNESPDSSIPASFFNDFKGPPVAAGHFSCSTSCAGFVPNDKDGIVGLTCASHG